MRLLRVVLCPRCDRCDAEAAGFGHWSELCERYAVELRALLVLSGVEAQPMRTKERNG